jgi:hypothetical protein
VGSQQYAMDALWIAAATWFDRLLSSRRWFYWL